MYRRHTWARAVVCALLTAGGLRAESGNPSISSFAHGGRLDVSPAQTGAWIHVEWASSLTGTWRRTWQSLANQASHPHAALELSVPLFYRVLSSPSPPPAGMVLVDAGPFRMGNVDTNEAGESWYNNEVPAHSVDVSAFYIDRYEVSNEQMRQVLQWAYEEGRIAASPGGVTNATGDPQELLDLADTAAAIHFTNGLFTVDAGQENHPVVMVSWYGAMAYCNYLSRMHGLEPCIDLSDWSCHFDAAGYRLPTEAEWEKAARGGLVLHHYPWPGSGSAWSNHVEGSKANYEQSGDPFDEGSSPRAYYNGSQSPAGRDMANGYGIYDMAGNVYEWCWDRYSGAWYSHPGARTKDTTGPTFGTLRVLRGGAWYRPPEFARCSFRHRNTPDFSYRAFGFRCVRSSRP